MQLVSRPPKTFALVLLSMTRRLRRYCTRIGEADTGSLGHFGSNINWRRKDAGSVLVGLELGSKERFFFLDVESSRSTYYIIGCCGQSELERHRPMPASLACRSAALHRLVDIAEYQRRDNVEVRREMEMGISFYLAEGEQQETVLMSV